MILDRKTTKTKFVDLYENYNFIVIDFFLKLFMVSKLY